MIAPMAELDRRCDFAQCAIPHPVEAQCLVPKPAASSAAGGLAREWRRNGLKRLNPRPKMVWSGRPPSHYIWYSGARPTARSDGQKRLVPKPPVSSSTDAALRKKREGNFPACKALINRETRKESRPRAATRRPT